MSKKINVPRCVSCGDIITKSDRKDFFKFGTCTNCTIQSTAVNPAPITVSKALWYPLFFLLLLVSLGFSTNYEVQVNATNWTCVGSFCVFSIPLDLNESNTNGSYITVYDSTQTTPLNFWRETGWNYATAAGNIWVNASNASTMFYVNYSTTGNIDASNFSKVFDLYANFSGTSGQDYKPEEYLCTGTCEVSGGALNITSGNFSFYRQINSSGLELFISYIGATDNSGMLLANSTFAQVVGTRIDSPGSNIVCVWYPPINSNLGSGSHTLYRSVHIYGLVPDGVAGTHNCSLYLGNQNFTGAITNSVQSSTASDVEPLMNFTSYGGNAFKLSYVMMRRTPLTTPSFTIGAETQTGASPFSAGFVTPTDTSGSTVTRNYIQINASSTNSTNITINFYNSGGTLLNTSFTDAATYLFLNISNIGDGTYYFNATAYNSTGAVAYSETRNVTINATRILTFIPPTPDSGVLWNTSTFTANVSINKNSTLCQLALTTNGSSVSGLWNNVKHLGIYGGLFDYNASLGLSGYVSRNMEYSLPVVAGIYTTCYLLNSGNSTCYGYNADGQSNPYTGGDAVSIGGGSYNCYVLSNGNGTCMGRSDANYGGGNAVQVANNHGTGAATCYLLNNGNSVCFGDNTYGQATNYSGGNAVKVSGNGANGFMCYLLNNGNSVCYGLINYGAAYNYTGGNAIDISSAITHTCYLLSNGNGICYGTNWDYTSNSSIVNYSGGDAIAVSVNLKDTCYLRSNGNVACYGEYHYGGGVIQNYTAGDAIGIAVGGTHSCILKTNMTSQCWGNNLYGAVVGYSGGNLKIPFSNSSSATTLYNMTITNKDYNTFANITLSGLSIGNYSYYATCDGTNSETRNITISPNTLPSVAIQSPTNSTYKTISIALNYTTVNAVSCWYVLNGGANQSLASCANATITAAQGNNNLILFVNNSQGNESNASVNFFADSILPVVTIQSPANTTYFTFVDLNFNAVDTYLDSCWYKLDSGANVSLPGCANTTLWPTVNASHILYVSANDTAGNTVTVNVSFYIDDTIPNIIIETPINTTYGSAALSVTYNVIAQDKCWYSLDGSGNISIIGCVNFTLTGLSNGGHYLIVFVNGSVSGAVVNDSVHFTVLVANITPTVTIVSPLNTTYGGFGTSKSVQLTFTQVNPNSNGICEYSLNGSAPVNIPSCTNPMLTGLVNGSYYVTVFVHDIFNQTANATVYFTVILYPAYPINQGILGQMEIAVGNTFMDIFGNPIFSGIMLLIVFGGLVLIARVREDGRIMILTPAILLAAVFLPGWFISVIGILVGGTIIALALLRLISR